jgi:putative ABC transport system permease protein
MQARLTHGEPANKLAAYSNAWRAILLRTGSNSVTPREEENLPPGRRPPMLDDTRHDVRTALRAVRRSPAFTTIVVLSIGLGVGATTAIVTLANTLLLKSPPGIGHADRVVTVGRTQDGSGFDNFSYPNYADYAANTKTLSGLAAIQIEPQSLSLAGPSGGEAVQAGLVSGSFFQVLEARPARGRFFLPAEDGPSATNTVAVLSHRFWRQRFGSDSTLVGRTIVLDGTPFTVVGISAERFQGPFVLAPDLWVPLHAFTVLRQGESSLFTSRQSVWLIAIGRLAPDVSIGAAQTELSTIAARLLQDYPQANAGQGVRVMPASLFPGDVRGAVGGFLAVLFAVAGLVLLIASTNVAGMLLARAAVRQREIAIRMAIGATRRRLVRQLVTESLVLFVAAGAVGIVLARWLIAALMTLVPRLPVQLYFDPRLDWRVFLFALGASLVTGLVVGAVPALQSTRPDLVPALKLDAGTTTRRQRLRGGLLVAQIAFSMLLLIVAGLFARALTHARSIDPGFDPRGVDVASLDLQLATYDEARGLVRSEELLARARQLPQVTAAAYTAMLPLGGGGMGLGGVEVDGRQPPDERRGWNMDWDIVTPGYFATMRIPLLRGRDFRDADRQGAPDVAILNETFARHLYGSDDPVGRTFRNGDRTVTVIGIARDGKYRTLGEPPRNFVYVPFAQRYTPRLNLVVRTTTGAPVAGMIKQLVSELDPALPILDQRTMDDQVATSLFPQRVVLWVAATLASVALLLALLGIYGVVAFSVAQRTREIGVRVALGAQRAEVLSLVLRQGAVLAGIGVAVGALGALAVTRLLASLLYGIPATDLVAFGAAAGLLAAAALAASWIPARRAAAIDPVIALRSE